MTYFPFWKGLAMTKEGTLPFADMLLESPIGTELTQDECQTLAPLFSEREYKGGDCIFEEGAPGNGVYVICSGSVRIDKKTAKGDYSEIAVLKKGDLFGELSLVTDLPRSGRVTMASDGNLAHLSLESFSGLATDDLKLHTKLVHTLGALACRRLSTTTLQVAKLLCKVETVKGDVSALSEQMAEAKKGMLGFARDLMFGA